MTDAESHQETLRFMRLIEHWCPAAYKEESGEHQLIRAFLHVTACCADQKRMLDHKDPVRQLDSYPDPMFEFESKPARG
jgi:hypothetical protein